MGTINEDTEFKFDKSSLVKNYLDSSKDIEFKKLIARLKVSDDLAMKYTSRLNETVGELKNCAKCKSLGECKNKVNGCVYYPNVQKNMISFGYVTCKYKKEYDESLRNTSNVFLEPFQIKMASIKDIDLTDKKRAPLIKWMKEFYKNYKTDKHQKGLFLHGSFGCGKTFILSALLNELAKNGANTVIIYYPEMLRNLKESFASDFDDKMNLLKTCDALLIDDLGAENVTGWNRDEILGTILQYRMESSLPTFITSNLNKEELTEHLSYTGVEKNIVKARRIMDRINQLTEDMEMISKNRRV